MHGKREDIPIAIESGPMYSRSAEWGNMNIAFEAFPAGTDTVPLFKGLPDDSCQCPHWGYLFKGRMRIRYTDKHDEVINAGEAYYLPPGHNALVEEDCALLEFSPKGEYQKTINVAARNMEAMRGGG